LKTVGSFLADAVPILGTVKGVQEVFTGMDYVTGQELSIGDRVATGVGTLVSFVPGGKVVGKTATKSAIDGGSWLIGQFNKQVRYAKPSDLFKENTYAPFGQSIAPNNLYRELNRSQVGQETISLIQSNGTKIRLDYGELPTDMLGNQILGKANMRTNTATIYVKGTESTTKTAQTIIHEVTHTSLQNPIYTQREEVIAFMREAKHSRDNLSYTQIKAIIQEVKSLYPTIPHR